MKNFVTVAGLSILTCLSSGVFAASDSYFDYAKVVSSTPITRMVHVPNQTRECWDEQVTRSVPNSSGGDNAVIGTVLGGAVGGVLGHQVGKGHGKTAATIAGSVVGAAVGNNIGSQNSNQGYTTSTGVEQRCRVVDNGYDEERVEGYNVRYEYHGKTYSIRTQKDPGSKLKVRVVTNISPVFEG